MDNKLEETAQEYIGNKVVAARKKSGLSQQALGDKVGLTRQTIGSLEAGESSTTQRHMIDIASALGVPLAYFYPSSSLEKENDTMADLVDQVTKDIMQLGPRKLKVAALVMRTLREDPGDLDT